MRWAVSFLALLCASALAGGREPPKWIDPQPLDSLRGHAFEVQWTGEMLTLHRLNVGMAHYELKAGKNQKVQRVAQVVIRQSQERFNHLKNWEARWNVNLDLFGPVDIDMPLPGQVDRWFIEQLILRQSYAFQVAKLAKSRTKNVSLLKMADSTVIHHAAQMNYYKALLKELP